MERLLPRIPRITLYLRSLLRVTYRVCRHTKQELEGVRVTVGGLKAVRAQIVLRGPDIFRNLRAPFLKRFEHGGLGCVAAFRFQQFGSLHLLRAV